MPPGSLWCPIQRYRSVRVLGKFGKAALALIYGWFTEGFNTADLMDAKALLEELS